MIVAPMLADLVSAMLGWALFLLSIFLILLILVQRGRGGGLTGALGGPGGQSAFGTKAGDLFTRITSFVALGWIALCAFTMWLIGSTPTSVAIDPAPTVSPSPADATTTTSDMIDFGSGDAAADGGALTPVTPDATAQPEGAADAEAPAAGAETPSAGTEAPAADTPPAEAAEAEPETETETP